MRPFPSTKELMAKLQNVELDDKKLLAIALFATLFLYVDISFIMKPQISGLKSSSAKAAKIKKDMDDFNRDYAAMSKMPAQQAGERVAANLKRVIDESDVASLMQGISDVANKFDIKINQIRPNRDTGAKDKVSGADKVVPLNIELDMVCDYHSLGKFINALEYGPNFIAVQEIKISQQPADYFKQKVSLVLRTYVKK
jgi:Tfp pilus assembly protein PilO